MRNVALLVGALGISLLIIASVPALHPLMGAGLTRLNPMTSRQTRLPTSPLREVIDWQSLRLIADRCQMFDGWDVRIPPTRVCINSDGFRDHDYTREKPSGVFRIVMVGDSHVFGWGVELEDTLPKQLEAHLNAPGSTATYEVLNMGVPSFGMAEEIIFLKEKGLSYGPDMIIFGFFSDDFINWRALDPQVEAARRDYLASHPASSAEEAEIHALSEVIKELNSIERTEDAGSLYSRTRRLFLELAEIGEKENISIVFQVYKWYPSQEALLREASAEFNFTLIHPEDSYFDLPGMVVHPQDTHPSAEANRIRAEFLAEELRGMIS